MNAVFENMPVYLGAYVRVDGGPDGVVTEIDGVTVAVKPRPVANDPFGGLRWWADVEQIEALLEA